MTRRVERIGDATLHLGDCRELLPTLDRVDVIVTDPPYPVTKTSITHRNKPGMIRGGWMQDGYPVNQEQMFDLPPVESWAAFLFDAGRTDAELYVMVNDRNLPAFALAFAAAGWKHHNLLVWKKPTGIPNRWYFKDAEFCLYLFKGKAQTIVNPESSTTFECPHPRDRVHPSEKPVPLMAHYIANARGVVLDPFMGSGTTGVACASLGRTFVGIESDPSTFDLACKRIEDAYRQPRLFADPPAVQESLL